MIDVTVKVPEERLSDFYSMYGRWLEASNATASDTGSAAEDKPLDWTSMDLELAKDVWGKFNDNAKALFSVLIDEPGREFTVDELTRTANVSSGGHGVAGMLSGPGKHCTNARRKSCWKWKPLASGVTVYWMPHEIADLFRQARDN